MNILKGYLTYILAALAILGGVAGYINGTVDTATATTIIWSGLVVFGIRRAVA